jgi:hypothetical protein
MAAPIAYCGSDCSACPTYLATQSGDRSELERLAALRRKSFGRAGITVESMPCDGCSAGGRLSWTCAVCPIRACAVACGHGTCDECDGYDDCEKLPMVHSHLPEAKATLDACRSRPARPASG